MKTCIKCGSSKIKVDTKNVEGDFQKVLKVSICLNCGYEHKDILNIHEESLS